MLELFDLGVEIMDDITEEFNVNVLISIGVAFVELIFIAFPLVFSILELITSFSAIFQL